MNKQTLINKLNRNDLPGVGCVVYYIDGCKVYRFYEDFAPDDKGIDRAARQYQELIDKGYVRRVDYIHKDADLLHFWDWDTKSGNFCANDEFVAYNKSKGYNDYYYDLGTPIVNINGIEYKYDYTPAIDGISAIKAIRR